MKINYATWLHTTIGISSEELVIPPNIDTVSQLLDYLEGRGISYKKALSRRDVIFAEAQGRVLHRDEPFFQNYKGEVTLFAPIVGG